MTTEDALKEYGYQVDSTGLYVRAGRRTQSWRKTGGGWLRFEADGSPCPMRVSPGSPVQAGLDFSRADHVQFFDWVWPDKEVTRIYEDAVAAVGSTPVAPVLSSVFAPTPAPAPLAKKSRFSFWRKN